MITLPHEDSLTLAQQMAEEDAARRVGGNLRMLSSAFNAKQLVARTHGQHDHGCSFNVHKGGFDMSTLAGEESAIPQTVSELEQAAPAPVSSASGSPQTVHAAKAAVAGGEAAVAYYGVVGGGVVSSEEVSQAVHRALRDHLDGPLQSIISKLSALRRDVNEIKSTLSDMPEVPVHVRVP